MEGHSRHLLSFCTRLTMDTDYIIAILLLFAIVGIQKLHPNQNTNPNQNLNPKIEKITLLLNLT